MATTRKPPTPRDLLNLLAEMAGDLRKAGVLHVELEGLSFQLQPHEPDPVRFTDADAATELDPLDDPATYGGGKVPSFRRVREGDEELS